MRAGGSGDEGESTVSSNRPLGLTGVHLVGPLPIGRLAFELRPGLTVLFGNNGVGKTRLIRSLAEVLSSTSYDPVTAAKDSLAEPSTPTVRRLPSPTMALYHGSGLHYTWPLTRMLWEDPGYSSPIEAALNESVFKASGGRTPPLSVPEYFRPTRCDWDDVVLLTMSRIGFEVSADEVEYLLGQGRWMVGCAPFAPAYLCDPHPMDGPLSNQWQADRDNWAAVLQSFKDEHWSNFDPDDPSWADCDPLDALWDEEINHTYFESDEGPRFPPLASQLSIAEFPAWFAYPVACVGAMWRHNPVGDLVEEDTADDVQKRTARLVPFLRDDGQPLYGPPLYDSEFASQLPTTMDTLTRLQVRANLLLATLFDEPPLLEARLTHPRDWFLGEPSIAWLATTQMSETAFDISALGAAHFRYAKFAIQRSLQGRGRLPRIPGTEARQRETLSFALIDEPEAALHPAAERQVAEGLKALADYVIVATHSTVVVDKADDSMHVTRNEGGGMKVTPLSVNLTPERRQTEARRLGQTPGTLAMLTRVVLVVEGAMDVSVVSAFLEPELRSARAFVIPLHGTAALPSLASADYLFHSTDAPVVICLDNTNARRIRDLSTQLRKTNDVARRRSLLYEARGSAEFTASPEMRKLADLLEAACTSGRLERIEVFGFRKQDIVHYIPVTLIKPGASSWDQLWDDFRAQADQRIGTGSGALFKKFVGRGYTVKGVDEALDRMRLELSNDQTLSTKRPVEFSRLADLVSELATKR